MLDFTFLNLTVRLRNVVFSKSTKVVRWCFWLEDSVIRCFWFLLLVLIRFHWTRFRRTSIRTMFYRSRWLSASGRKVTNSVYKISLVQLVFFRQISSFRLSLAILDRPVRQCWCVVVHRAVFWVISSLHGILTCNRKNRDSQPFWPSVIIVHYMENVSNPFLCFEMRSPLSAPVK